MNIYLVEQDINNGYDTYDSFVCVAETEQDARETHPSDFVTHYKDGEWHGTYEGGGEYVIDSYDWIRFEEISLLKVSLIGVANADQTKGVILASFNAG